MALRLAAVSYTHLDVYKRQHLAHGLEKGQRLDVANRAADLDDRHLCGIG